MNARDDFHLRTIWHPKHSDKTIREHFNIIKKEGEVIWLTLYDPEDEEMKFKGLSDADLLKINEMADGLTRMLFIKCRKDYNEYRYFAGKIKGIERTNREQILKKLSANDDNLSSLLPAYYREVLDKGKLEVSYAIKLSKLEEINEEQFLCYKPIDEDFISGKFLYPFPCKIFQEKSCEIFKQIKSDYVFRKTGTHWRFSFEGMKDEIIIKHMKGFAYFRYLLRKPRDEFELQDLVTEVEGHTTVDYQGIKKQLNSLQDDYDIVLPQYASKILNMQLKDLYKYIKEIVEDDPDKAENLTRVLVMLEEIKSSKEYKGMEREYKRVWKCMSEAREAIKTNLDTTGESLALYEHLKKSLPLKFPICYKPDKDIVWDTGE